MSPDDSLRSKQDPKKGSGNPEVQEADVNLVAPSDSFAVAKLPATVDELPEVSTDQDLSSSAENVPSKRSDLSTGSSQAESTNQGRPAEPVKWNPPRVTPGIVMSVISIVSSLVDGSYFAFLTLFPVFFYWCFCQWRISRLLKRRFPSQYRLHPMIALLSSASIANPTFVAGLWLAGGAYLIGVGYSWLLSWMAHNPPNGKFVQMIFTWGCAVFVQSQMILLAVAIIALSIMLFVPIANVINKARATKQRVDGRFWGALAGTGFGVGSLWISLSVPGHDPNVSAFEVYKDWLPQVFLLHAVSFLVAFMVSKRLVKELNESVSNSDE